MARPAKGVTFWDRVYSNTERDGACLLFMGNADACGYGRLRRNGQTVGVHREVWSRANGPVPSGRVIMHSCDKPNCIELAHLSLGTQADNIRDMNNKGRQVAPRGAAQSRAILCENDIPIIRHWIMEKHNFNLIADAFGVSRSAIYNVKYGRAWRHVGHG